jgi:hypothetical protein
MTDILPDWGLDALVVCFPVSTWLTSWPRPCQERPLLDAWPTTSSWMTFFRRYLRMS